MNTKKTLSKFAFFQFLIVITVFIFACNDDTAIPNSNIDLENAKLNDFPLEEINYSDIEIIQPIIKNNEEITKGEITITVPYTVISLNLTLKSVNINTSEFSIFPDVGVQSFFSEKEYVTYKITSKIDPEKSLHYKIKVLIEEKPKEEKLSLTTFELIDVNHKDKPYTDIDLTTKATSQAIDSLAFCLFPVPVNYSKLTPAITYEGSKIEYRTNNNNFKEYPITTGAEIDFSYPNTVDFKISNTDNSKFKIYRIIVDTDYPVIFSGQTIIQPNLNQGEFLSHSVTVPNVKMGSTYNGVGVTTWKNMGNYPISNMSPNEYTNTTGPVADLNIFTTTLSSTGGNINPGEEGTVNIVITNTPMLGTYKSTAEFHLRFNQNSFRTVNSPEDNYILNIGYKKFQLNIEGTVTN